MLKYLLSILALATLTALWMVFQLWIKKHNPDQEGPCGGCGSCKRDDGGDPVP